MKSALPPGVVVTVDLTVTKGYTVSKDGKRIGRVYKPTCGVGGPWTWINARHTDSGDNQTKVAAIIALVEIGTHEPSCHDLYHARHLCRHCGLKCDEHAGYRNPHCPVGRCPAIESWARMVKFPSFAEGRTGAEIDADLAEFWSKQSTVFAPV